MSDGWKENRKEGEWLRSHWRHTPNDGWTINYVLISAPLFKVLTLKCSVVLNVHQTVTNSALAWTGVLNGSGKARRGEHRAGRMGDALSVSEHNKLAVAAISHIVHFDRAVYVDLSEQMYERSMTAEDGSTAVTQANFAEAMASVKIHPSDREILDRLFILHDRAGDGIINVKEFVVGTSILVKGKPMEKFQLAFELYDREKTGALNKDGLLQALQWLVRTGTFFGDKPPTEEALSSLADRVFVKIVDESPVDPSYVIFINPIISHPLLDDWINQEEDCPRLASAGEL